MGSWVTEREEVPPLTELCEQSPSTSCKAERSGLCHHCVSLEDVHFFFFLILSKTKSRPPVEFLCRGGWVLGEPSSSPSETPGTHSTSQHLPVCSPVRFHPLVLMIAFILFPSTLLPSNKSTFLPLFPISPLC